MRLSLLVLAVSVLIAFVAARNLPLKQHPAYRHAPKPHNKPVLHAPSTTTETAKHAKHGKGSFAPRSSNFDLELQSSSFERELEDFMRPSKPLNPTASDLDDALEAESLVQKSAKVHKKQPVAQTQAKEEPEFVSRVEKQVQELTKELNSLRHQVKELEETQVASKASTTHQAQPVAAAEDTTNKKEESQPTNSLIDDFGYAVENKLKDWGLTGEDDNTKVAATTEQAPSMATKLMDMLGVNGEADAKEQANVQEVTKSAPKLEEADDAGDDDDDDESAKQVTQKKPEVAAKKDTPKAESDNDNDDDEDDKTANVKDAEEADDEDNKDSKEKDDTSAKKDEEVSTKQDEDDASAEKDDDTTTKKEEDVSAKKEDAEKDAQDAEEDADDDSKQKSSEKDTAADADAEDDSKQSKETAVASAEQEDDAENDAVDEA